MKVAFDNGRISCHRSLSYFGKSCFRYSFEFLKVISFFTYLKIHKNAIFIVVFNKLVPSYIYKKYSIVCMLHTYFKHMFFSNDTFSLYFYFIDCIQLQNKSKFLLLIKTKLCLFCFMLYSTFLLLANVH